MNFMADEHDLENASQFALLRATCERDFVLALLDAAIRNEVAVIAEVLTWFSPTWIMDPLYSAVTDTVLELVKNKRPLSSSTLAKAVLDSTKTFQADLRTISTLITNAFGWHNLSFYGQQVYDEYRRVAASCDAEQAVSELRTGDDVQEGLDELAEIPDRYTQLQITRIDRVQEAIQEIISEIEGVTTPHFRLDLPRLDQITGGFHNGSYITVAAPTGGGKTVFLGQAAIVRVTRDKLPVLYFSGEMTLKELIGRWASFLTCKTRYERRDYIQGLAQLRQLTSHGGPLQVFECPMHIDKLVNICRGFATAQPVGLICCDYVQMYLGGGPKDTRERQIADITGKLKALAMELHVPVIGASQFNRAYVGTPTMQNLRDSGSIAQDSDVVIMLAPTTKKDDTIPIVVAVPKNRHGTTGDVELQWNKPIFTIEDPTTSIETTPEAFTHPDFPGYGAT